MDPGTSWMLESQAGGTKSLSTLPRPLQKFYRGEPLALGITQIFTGFVNIAMGILISFPEEEFLFINFVPPYCAGILYIISGSLSVAAARNPKLSLVKGSLGMNVVSAVAAGIEIVFFCCSALIAMVAGDRHFACDLLEYSENPDPEELQLCYKTIIIPHAIKYYIAVILFLFTLLEFILSILTSSFGCATLCRNAYSEMTVVIYQKTAEEAPPALPVSCKEEP